jgi:hypothetical protein
MHAGSHSGQPSPIDRVISLAATPHLSSCAIGNIRSQLQSKCICTNPVMAEMSLLLNETMWSDSRPFVRH